MRFKSKHEVFDIRCCSCSNTDRKIDETKHYVWGSHWGFFI